MNEEQRLVQKRLRVLEHAKKTGNVRKPVAILVSPDPVFTAGKELLIKMVNQAWLTNLASGMLLL